MSLTKKILAKIKKKKVEAIENETITEKSEDGLEKWDNKFQYLASLVGMSIGLGNIWNKCLCFSEIFEKLFLSFILFFKISSYGL